MSPKKLFLSSVTFFVLVSLPFISSVGASSVIWSQTYGGAGEEIAYSLVLTSDGGYAIAGTTRSFGAGNLDFWLVKTDEYGIIPEFPSWTILPIVLVSTLAVICIRNKISKKWLN